MKLNAIICDSYSYIDRNIEIMTLKCRHDFGKVFYIMIVYRPPSGSYEDFLKDMSDFIDVGNLCNDDLYICEDFYIDFLHRNDAKMKSLVNFLRIFGFKQLINSPTRVTGFSKSCIDFLTDL